MDFRGLVHSMVDADLDRLSRERQPANSAAAR
jgi:hypothetical protein